jgi:hypothetical protein
MHQWEYCRLVVWEVKQHKEKGYSCNTYISYSDSTGVKGYKLTEVDKQVLPYPPFDRVIGLLVSYRLNSRTKSKDFRPPPEGAPGSE